MKFIEMPKKLEVADTIYMFSALGRWYPYTIEKVEEVKYLGYRVNEDLLLPCANYGVTWHLKDDLRFNYLHLYMGETY